MKSLEYERRLPSGGLQAVLVIGCGLVLARLIVNEPMPLVIAALIGVVLTIVFVLRPDLGLLLTLIIRAFSDAFIGRMADASGGGGLIVRLLTSPNAGMILLVILGGGLYLLTHRTRFLRLPGASSLLFLLLIGGIGLLRAPSLTAGLDRWLADWSALIVYGVAAAVFSKPQQIQRVINVLAVAFIVPALVGLNQYVTRHGCRVDEAFLRICGTFTHPNPFAFFLVIILSVFLCQALVQHGGRRLLAWSIVGLSAILLIGTQTRSGWVGTLIVLLTVGATRNRRLLLIAPLLVGLAVVLIPSISSRVSDPLSGSTAGRLNIWTIGYNNWLDVTHNSMSPFATVLNRMVGTGPDSVGGLTQGWAAHNDYLLVFLEYGALGLAAFLAMFLSLIVSAFRTWRLSRNHMLEPVALSFLAVTLAYPAMHLSDNLLGRTQNQLYFWTLAGLTAAIGHLTARAKQSPSAPSLADPGGSPVIRSTRRRDMKNPSGPALARPAGTA